MTPPPPRQPPAPPQKPRPSHQRRPRAQPQPGWERGKISLTREPLQLEALIARALETVQPLITERRHELSVEIEEAGLSVEGDLTRLTQIIGNILSNAARYTESGGHI